MFALLRQKRALRRSLAEIATILDGTDQSYWADVLRSLRDRVEDQSGQAARDVLALYEGPRAPRGATEGNWALDTVGVTRGGNAYTVDDPVLWEQTLRYARLLHSVYQDALRLWHASDVARVPLPAPTQQWVKLADYGWGSQVWQCKERYLVRYDNGGHASRWREDEINAAEAEQGMLGSTHFSRMVVELQSRLEAAGVDLQSGSYQSLPEPPQEP